jgi:probable F420-dependent oxidoreductase
MRIGLTIFATDLTIHPATLAAEAEARGFGSLYLPEHTHIPTSRITPPPSGDDVLAEEYARTLDPLVALTAAATVTQDLLVGTGVALVAQHDPITYAKAWATLDQLSGGRAVLGVGFGWNIEEMADHGIDARTRRQQAAEHVAAMRALWTHDAAGFDGDFVQFAESWSWPKPHGGRTLPVLIGGGAGPKLLGHVAAWADGWMPIGSSGLSESVPRLQQLWADAGRAGSPRVVPFGVVPTAAKLERIADLGCDEVVVRVPSAGDREVLAALDELAWVVDGFSTPPGSSESLPA